MKPGRAPAPLESLTLRQPLKETHAALRPPPVLVVTASAISFLSLSSITRRRFMDDRLTVCW